MFKKYSLVLLFLWFGCDLFQTRLPENPVNQSSGLKPPFTPMQSIDNFKSSVSSGVKRDYISCFVDSNYSNSRYFFSANAEASGLYPELRIDWNLRDEEQYFSNLYNRIPAGEKILLQLNTPQLTQLGDSALYRSLYMLSFSLSGNSQIQIYQGEISLRLKVDSRGWWVITRWEDIKVGASNTWSDLKGQYN